MVCVHMGTYLRVYGVTSLCGGQRSIVNEFYHIVLKCHDQRQLTEGSLFELTVPERDSNDEGDVAAGSQGQ